MAMQDVIRTGTGSGNNIQQHFYECVKIGERTYAKHHKLVTHVGPMVGAVLMIIGLLFWRLDMAAELKLVVGLLLLDVSVMLVMIGLGAMLVGLSSGLRVDGGRSRLTRVAISLTGVMLMLTMSLLGGGLMWCYLDHMVGG